MGCRGFGGDSAADSRESSGPDTALMSPSPSPLDDNDKALTTEHFTRSLFHRHSNKVFALVAGVLWFLLSFLLKGAHQPQAFLFGRRYHVVRRYKARVYDLFMKHRIQLVCLHTVPPLLGSVSLTPSLSAPLQHCGGGALFCSRY